MSSSVIRDEVERAALRRLIDETLHSPGTSRRGEVARAVVAALLVTGFSLMLATTFYLLPGKTLSGNFSELLGAVVGGGAAVLAAYVLGHLTSRKTRNFGKAVREEEKDFFNRVDKIIHDHVRKAD